MNAGRCDAEHDVAGADVVARQDRAALNRADRETREVVILAAIRETNAVKGLAHITGGGFPDNIPRVLPKGLGARIDLARVPVLPVFQWLAKVGRIAEPEMLRTFNCGIGMIAVVEPGKADAVAAVLKRHGEKVARIGEVVPVAKGKRVNYTGCLNI